MLSQRVSERHIALLSHPPAIELANGSFQEALTRDMLFELFAAYPLDKWRYAERIRIKDNVIPHSHPVLTLASQPDRHNPLRLLSSYIHEQLHWFWLLEQHADRRRQVWQVIRTTYSNIPVSPPEGCGSERSNYLHVAINYWEYLALTELVDEETARSFIERKPYYKAVYGLVLTEGKTIRSILDQYELMPPAMPPKSKRFVVPDSASSPNSRPQ